MTDILESIPPVRINQNHLEPIVIISNNTLPDKSLSITQRALSSLGDTETIQVIRVDRASLTMLIKTLQALQSMS
jgi:ethanolamine utilization protein EutP (predicted NTPase)